MNEWINQKKKIGRILMFSSVKFSPEVLIMLKANPILISIK